MEPHWEPVTNLKNYCKPVGTYVEGMESNEPRMINNEKHLNDEEACEKRIILYGKMRNNLLVQLLVSFIMDILIWCRVSS